MVLKPLLLAGVVVNLRLMESPPGRVSILMESTPQHNSFTYEDELVVEDELHVCAIEAVDGELLGLLCFSSARESQKILCQSEGFGGEAQEMMWETVSCDVLEDHEFSHFMCPIQL